MSSGAPNIKRDSSRTMNGVKSLVPEMIVGVKFTGIKLRWCLFRMVFI